MLLICCPTLAEADYEFNILADDEPESDQECDDDAFEPSENKPNKSPDRKHLSKDDILRVLESDADLGFNQQELNGKFWRFIGIFFWR
jgi:hypothetical protein